MKERLSSLLDLEKGLSMAVLYGSFASGEALQSSDIDVAVYGEEAIDLETKLDLAARISQVTGREVDLVDLRSAHGALLSEILTRGVIILLRDPNIYEQLLKRMWYEHEDDGRFIEKTLQERLRAWKKINGQLLVERSETVLRCLQRIRSKMPAALGPLLSDFDAQDIIILNLERAVQACVDIAAHIIAHTPLPAASSMVDSFKTLEDAGILDEQLASRMGKAVGLRNILVHQYRAIDWNIVWAVLERHLDDPVAFIKAVKTWKDAVEKNRP